MIKFIISAADLSDKLRRVVEEALYPELRNFFGFGVTDGLITGYLVTALLLIFAAAVRIFAVPKFTVGVPGKLQSLLEWFVSYFDKASTNAAHRHASFLGPYMFTSAAFIALTTLVELIGLRPAFSTINACLAFGLSTFIIIQICGAREHGFLRRVKRVLNPINIITDISVPLSLSLRLFGAVTSGFIIMELLYATIYTSFAIPALASVVTTLFHALIQAYLFSTLTSVFVGEAVELDEIKH